MPGALSKMGLWGRGSLVHAAWMASVLTAGSIEAKSFTWPVGTGGQDEVEFWLDPYYTALNLTHSLASSPIVRLDADAEREADLWLLRHFFHPRDVLLEGSVNPLPVAGWAVRKWEPEGYRDAALGGANLVQAATEGFPEPWAVSLFLGNVVNLVSGADTSKVNGVGYSGMLVSVGAWHLVRNRMVRDDWMEAEVKIKGDDIRVDRKLGWSFRLGLRENSHPQIRDMVYAALVRRRTDFQYRGFDLLRNSSIELRLDVDQRRMVPVRVWAVVGKKFPFAGGKAAFCLSVGAVGDLRPAYDGELRSDAPRGIQLVLQPNIEW